MPENQLPMHNNKILQGIIDASKQRRPDFFSENIAPKNGCAPRTNKIVDIILNYLSWIRRHNILVIVT